MQFKIYTQKIKQFDEHFSFREDIIYDNLVYFMKILNNPNKQMDMINIIRKIIEYGDYNINSDIIQDKLIKAQYANFYNLYNVGKRKNKFIKEINRSYILCSNIENKYDDNKGIEENKVFFENNDINNLVRFFTISNRCIAYRQLVNKLTNIQYILGSSKSIPKNIYNEYEIAEESFIFNDYVIDILYKHMENENNDIIKKQLQYICKELFETINRLGDYYKYSIKNRINNFTEDIEDEQKSIIRLIKEFNKIMNEYKFVPKVLIEIYLLTNDYNLTNLSEKSNIYGKICRLVHYIINKNNEIKSWFPELWNVQIEL